ncbi:HAMP domain-containing sensor histidine kinase [Sinomonas halotolerans]|uniref:histidine kinase n=1 Tax=Sinomonas halotolerans TaxID=1644133 RepID=A0ABU9WYI4_9MICC
MTVSEQAIVGRATRYFQSLRPRARVLLSQLPLTAGVTAIFLAGPSLLDNPAAHPGFQIGLWLQLAALIACVAIPWEHFDAHAPLTIPLLDLVSLWFLRNGSDDQILGLGNLAVFPVIWLAGSTLSAAWVLPLTFFSGLAITLPTLLDGVPDPTPSQWATTMLLPLLLLTVALAIRTAGAGLRSQERQVRAQQKQLQRLLDTARETERLVNAILDTVDVGIVAVSPQGRLSRLNVRFRRMLADAGLSLDSASAAPPSLPLLDRDGRTRLPESRQPLRRAAEGGSIDGEVVWMGHEDSARALSVRARPLDGGGAGGVVTFGDVTGLMEDVEAKAELVRTVAHEFRTPLTSVLGHLELALEAEELQSAVRRRVTIAHGSAERLLRVASDLLASSAEVLPVRPAPTDLAPTLRERSESAQPAATAASITINVDVQEPLHAHADAFRIGQAVDNLLSNAIKYSPEGGRVTLSAHSEDGWVTIGVRDTGMGIRPEDLPMVFERFFRSDVARRAHIPGVGLGLAIVRMIAERHGGSLACESEPDRGSLFTLRIPSAAHLGAGAS